MSDQDELLEPILTERADFTFGDLFRTDDPVAAWLVNLSRAVDDLLLANRRLARNLALSGPREEPEPRNHEVIYDIKAVVSHAWELAKFIQLESSNDPVIADFIGSRVPDQARTDLAEALAALEPDDDDPPNRKAFKATLASARDQASHYSKVNHDLVEKALLDLQTDFEGEPNKTSLLLGENFKDFYAPYATEMDWQLFHPIGDGDMEAFKRFNTRLNELVGRLIRFSATAVHCYFRDHEADTARVELGAVLPDRARRPSVRRRVSPDHEIEREDPSGTVAGHDRHPVGRLKERRAQTDRPLECREDRDCSRVIPERVHRQLVAIVELEPRKESVEIVDARIRNDHSNSNDHQAEDVVGQADLWHRIAEIEERRTVRPPDSHPRLVIAVELAQSFFDTSTKADHVGVFGQISHDDGAPKNSHVLGKVPL